ncbi:hypothetical protein GQ42DRAFT_154735 [Ramicandelaber brevisporus]|nr:hypothetical protein GQ42DRAFT_154735 [Ramicandelaber brevisporus]
MTCCDLRAAAQELCTGLAGNCASQLEALSELQSWLKLSLPASSSAGSGFLLTRNDYRGKEFDEAASKTEALRDISVFIDAIPRLMSSSNAEVVAASVRTFALFLYFIVMCGFWMLCQR